MSLITQYKILPALSSLKHSCPAIVSLMIVPFLLASSAECTAKVLSAPGLKSVIESFEKTWVAGSGLRCWTSETQAVGIIEQMNAFPWQALPKPSFAHCC